jgi:uncharacterized alkaline shock family protein YloU/uncharacterized membrane protein
MSEASIPQTGKQQQREAAERAAAQESREEQETAPRGPLQTSRGVTTLDETVVAKIAGMATREVPGVHDMGNAVRRAFSAVTDRIPNGRTDVTGGIAVEKGDTQAAVDVTVVVEYGASIVEVGNAIRRNVIEQVEGTTGLEVIEVNVNVVDVHLPGQDEEPAAEPRGTALHPERGVPMKTSQFALLVGLLLGAVLAFGSFGQFFLVLLFAAIGLAVGMTIEGRIEVRGLTDRWRR